jgi:hypothetical protein
MSNVIQFPIWKTLTKEQREEILDTSIIPGYPTLRQCGMCEICLAQLDKHHVGCPKKSNQKVSVYK